MSYTVLYVIIYLIGCAVMHYLLDKVEEKIENIIAQIPAWVWYVIKGFFIIGSWISFISIMIIGLKRHYDANK